MGKRIYEFDENFFEEINTEEKAYWLGFISADGYINVNTREVNINLSITDKEHLVKFLTHLEHSNHNVLKYNSAAYSKDYKKTEKVSLGLSSVKMNSDLRKLGLDNNKSETLKKPIGVPKELEHHFIRGFFDGNGGVSYTLNTVDRFNKKIGWHRKQYYHPRFIFSSTLAFLTYINNTLPVQCKTILFDKRTEYSHVLDYRSKIRYIKIRDYLYKDATVYLERKFQKIQDINTKLSI